MKIIWETHWLKSSRKFLSRGYLEVGFGDIPVMKTSVLRNKSMPKVYILTITYATCSYNPSASQLGLDSFVRDEHRIPLPNSCCHPSAPSSIKTRCQTPVANPPFLSKKQKCVIGIARKMLSKTCELRIRSLFLMLPVNANGSSRSMQVYATPAAQSVRWPKYDDDDKWKITKEMGIW